MPVNYYVISCLLIVGVTAFFCSSNLADINLDITMDNNTRIAIHSLNNTVANLEIPMTMIYGAEDCQFITERQEYWCIDVYPFQEVEP